MEDGRVRSNGSWKYSREGRSVANDHELPSALAKMKIQGGVMCTEGMVVSFATTHLQFLEIFRRCVMRGASELSVKTFCQLWKDSDTPPVLKESDLNFRSEQNQQRIDTLIIWSRRKFHHRNTSRTGMASHARHCCR